MSRSDPEICQQIIDQLATRDEGVRAAELAGIQHMLGMEAVSKTQFRKALGSLAHRGLVTWQRSSWGSNNIVRLGVYK